MYRREINGFVNRLRGIQEPKTNQMEPGRAARTKEICLRTTECRIQSLRRKQHCYWKITTEWPPRAHSSSWPRNSIDSYKWGDIHIDTWVGIHRRCNRIHRRHRSRERTAERTRLCPHQQHTARREDYALPRLLSERMAMHLCRHIYRRRIWKNQKESQRLQRRLIRKQKRIRYCFARIPDRLEGGCSCYQHPYTERFEHEEIPPKSKRFWETPKFALAP